MALQFMAQNHFKLQTFTTSWNFLQSHFTGINLKETSANQIKHLIKNYFFTLYDNSVTNI